MPVPLGETPLAPSVNCPQTGTVDSKSTSSNAGFSKVKSSVTQPPLVVMPIQNIKGKHVFLYILVCCKFLLVASAGFLEDLGSHPPQEDQDVPGDPIK